MAEGFEGLKVEVSICASNRPTADRHSSDSPRHLDQLLSPLVVLHNNGPRKERYMFKANTAKQSPTLGHHSFLQDRRRRSKLDLFLPVHVSWLSFNASRDQVW